jgi:MerR family mercuric resistance operon transcriptional regulator
VIPAPSPIPESSVRRADYNSQSLGHLTLDYAPECIIVPMNTNMQIGQLAKRTALTVDAIRFYEKRGLLPKPARTEGRFRLYSNDDIERLNFVRQMRVLGFSLREIRELTDLRTDKIEACESMRDLLKRKLVEVRRKLRELEGLESQLVVDLTNCNEELKHRNRHEACECPMLKEVHVK